MTAEQIKDWFHQKRNQFKTGKMKKFTESCWRFVFYLAIWTYGFVILYQVNLISILFYMSNELLSAYRKAGFGTHEIVGETTRSMRSPTTFIGTTP